MHGKGRASVPVERCNVRKTQQFWWRRSISEECLTKTLVFPLQHRLRALRRRSLPGWRWSASSRVPPGRSLKSDKETLKAVFAPELGGRKALILRSAGGMVCDHQRTVPYRAFLHESCSYPMNGGIVGERGLSNALSVSDRAL